MRIIIFCVILFSLISQANAIPNESARINGVTDFLIDRANETYFYIFEKQMRDHPLFPCYFPETYSYVNEGELKALLRSTDIWQEAMDKDFETLLIRTITAVVSKSIDFNEFALQATNDYAELVQFLNINLNGREYNLDFIPTGTSEADRDIINGFYDGFNNARDIMLMLNKELAGYDDVCSSEIPTREIMKEKLDRLIESGNDLSKWLDHIKRYKSELTVNMEKLESECQINPSLGVCRTREKLVDVGDEIKASLEIPIDRVVAYAATVKTYITNIEMRKSYTSKVIESFRIISDENIDKEVRLKQLRNYLLFIAQVADSTTSEEVTNLLKEYTLPTTSFLAKREPRENHFLITAYFSYSAAQIVNDNDVPADNTSGFYVPIGIEYSRGTNRRRALSVMFSPFDFGYPVSLKMNGIEKDFEFDEIFAPSISFAYGLSDYPINLGVAFQIGRQDEDSGREEKRLMIFIGFDMPLFSLY